MDFSEAYQMIIRRRKDHSPRVEIKHEIISQEQYEKEISTNNQIPTVDLGKAQLKDD